MNVKCIRKTLVNRAKEKLAQHKHLGQRSGLSILEVAQLLDIVSGKTISGDITPSLLVQEPFFSLN